tara:strand:- start:50 stop:901 length:852 start_codon:yes stop_codon:yes gene_type:complete
MDYRSLTPSFRGWFRGTLRRFIQVEAPLLAASLSHFGTLAIVPFLMVGAGLMESVPTEGAQQITELGTTEAYESFARPVRAFLPFIESEMAEEVRTVVRGNAWKGVVGYLALFITASLFGWGLLRVHCRIFRYESGKKFVAERIQVFVFLFASLLMAGLSSLLWHGLDSMLEGWLRDSVFSTTVLALGFVVSIKWFGRGRILWWPVLIGTLLFCVAWQGAMLIFSNYVESRSFYATYGTLGGVACVMAWLYYASIVYLFSACLIAELSADGGTHGVEDAGPNG